MGISGPDGRARAVVVGAAVLVLVVAALVGTAVLRAPASPRTTPATATAQVGPAARSVPVVAAVGALAVLRDWDRERAEAWAVGDVSRLRALYLPGSAAGARDVAMLRAWRARGLRVEGMRTQVVDVELRRRSARRIVLVVTDRLVAAEAVRRDGRRRALPRDSASTRWLRFHLVGGRWLLGAAREGGGPT